MSTNRNSACELENCHGCQDVFDFLTTRSEILIIFWKTRPVKELSIPPKGAETLKLMPLMEQHLLTVLESATELKWKGYILEKHCANQVNSQVKFEG
jgi:hypothetical protein